MLSFNRHVSRERSHDVAPEPFGANDLLYPRLSKTTLLGQRLVTYRSGQTGMVDRRIALVRGRRLTMIEPSSRDLILLDAVTFIHDVVLDTIPH